MENWLINIMNEYGYLGIMVLIAFENVFPPVPSELILTFAGFMTTTSNMSVIGVIISSTVGSVIGAIILYLIGLQLNVEKLEKIVDKWGHFIKVSKKDVQKADNWFEKYGPLTVFFCRFIPLIRSLISIPAGMTNMNFVTFLVFTTIGTFIWNVVLIYLGATVGSSWHIIVDYMDIYSKFIYIALFVILIVFIFIKIKKKN